MFGLSGMLAFEPGDTMSNRTIHRGEAAQSFAEGSSLTGVEGYCNVFL